MTFPVSVQQAIGDARALEREVEQGTARNVLARARMQLAVIDAYCVGPEAAARSAAVLVALVEKQIEVAW